MAGIMEIHSKYVVVHEQELKAMLYQTSTTLINFEQISQKSRRTFRLPRLSYSAYRTTQFGVVYMYVRSFLNSSGGDSKMNRPELGPCPT